MTLPLGLDVARPESLPQCSWYVSVAETRYELLLDCLASLEKNSDLAN
jgi:hypothetical protein